MYLYPPSKLEIKSNALGVTQSISPTRTVYLVCLAFNEPVFQVNQVMCLDLIEYDTWILQNRHKLFYWILSDFLMFMCKICVLGFSWTRVSSESSHVVCLIDYNTQILQDRHKVFCPIISDTLLFNYV